MRSYACSLVGHKYQNITYSLFFCFSDYDTKFPSGGEDWPRPLWNGEGSVANLEPLENMWSHVCDHYSDFRNMKTYHA